MPIAGGISIIQPAIKSAFSLDRAATAQTASQLIGSALASIAPMGLFPPAPTPIPLVPGGAAGTISMLQQAFSLGQAATADVSAQMMAVAISILVPYVPPAGLQTLKEAIKSAFSLDRAATPDTASQLIAAAIPSYFMTGGAV